MQSRRQWIPNHRQNIPQMENQLINKETFSDRSCIFCQVTDAVEST
jgi:hypothetical protein